MSELTQEQINYKDTHKAITHRVEFTGPIGKYGPKFYEEELLSCIKRNLPKGYNYYKNPENDQFVWEIRGGDYIDNGAQSVSNQTANFIFYLCCWEDESEGRPYDLALNTLRTIADKICTELNLDKVKEDPNVP